MLLTPLVRDLAAVTTQADQQRAAGTLSAAEHTRLLIEIQHILDEHNLTWDDLAAAMHEPPTSDITGQSALWP